MGHRRASLALVCLLVGCGVPVNVRTPNPLQVDVTLKVDIVQRKVETAGEEQTPAPTSDAGTSDEETRRRDRMGQIQTFKNSRLVAENRNGLLTIMRLPPGEYGKQVAQAVAAENADRTVLMKVEAGKRRLPLASVEAEQAAAWRERAFPGEWIEEQQPDKTWRFVQKQSETPPAALAPPAAGAR